MDIAYLVHNVDDAAVLKRVELLRMGGANVRLAGFERFSDKDAVLRANAVLVLGRTFDAKLLARAFSVLKVLLWPFRLVAMVRQCDVIVCRNLEMLVLGWAANALAGGRRTLNYECLDINRKMLGDNLSARLLRAIERHILVHTHSIITSSKAFVHNYFDALQQYKGRICLIENKLLPNIGVASQTPTQPVDRWKIGWFGILRCSKSLKQLIELARRVPQLDVVIAGRVAEHEFEDFHGQILSAPNVVYQGPFLPSQLSEVYRQVHFVWAIDYFEEGDNSNWLLPNRLYDSLAFGAVPIALRSVETGRWLMDKSVGVVIDRAPEDLVDLLTHLTFERYQALKSSCEAIDRNHLIHSTKSAEELVEAIQYRCAHD